MTDFKISYLVAFISIICFQVILGEITSILEDAPHFLEEVGSGVTTSNHSPRMYKSFLREKDYRFLVLTNVKSHNTDVVAYIELLSESKIKVLWNVNPSSIATCGRLLIGNNQYDVIILEIEDCLDDLLGLTKMLRNRFPHALILYLSPWNPKLYFTEVTNDLGETEYKDVVTIAGENKYIHRIEEAEFLLDLEYEWKLSEDYNKQMECLVNAAHEINGFALIKSDDRPIFQKTANEVLFSRTYLYSDDWYTLNQDGEDNLARGIAYILQHMDHPKKDKLGEWPPLSNLCRRKRPINQKHAKVNARRRPRRPRPRLGSRSRNNNGS